MENIGEINKTVKKNKDIAADSNFTTVVSVAGSTIKYLATDPEKGTMKMSTVTVSPDSVMEKVGKKIPSLELLHDFATQAVVLAKEFKNTASRSLKFMEEVKKGLSELTEGEGFA
jgi:nitrogen fixation protein FixH